MSQKLRSFHFRPALLDSLKHYRRPDFMADLGAGLTVACVALRFRSVCSYSSHTF